MAFAIDQSGSVGSLNFEKIKTFVKDVIKAFKIGPEQTRVALVKYSSYADTEFDMNAHASEEELLNAVSAMTYEGGSTNTHAALDIMRQKLFKPENGARPEHLGHPRVGILLTDGRSNYPSLTKSSANLTHRDDITLFAIGVGRTIDIVELDSIASPPICQHKFLLKGFQEINDLKYAIQKRTCQGKCVCVRVQMLSTV